VHLAAVRYREKLWPSPLSHFLIGANIKLIEAVLGAESPRII
jgi:hypothetical protein